MAYLLDTDFVIELLRGRARALRTLSDLGSQRLAISLISVGETYEGAFRSANPQQHLGHFRDLLRPFPVLELNDPIMERFAEIRSNLRRRGELIADLDIMVGATALHHDLALLTYNVRHMDRIDMLNIYRPG